MQLLLEVRTLVLEVQTDAAVGAAVLGTDHDLLRDVDETTGQVTRVGGSQSGVGQTLTSTVRRDEVLEHGETLTEVRADRPRDDLTSSGSPRDHAYRRSAGSA